MEPQLHQSRHSIHIECVVVNICFVSHKSICVNLLQVLSCVSGKRPTRPPLPRVSIPITLCPSRIQTTGGRVYGAEQDPEQKPPAVLRNSRYNSNDTILEV